MFLGKKYQETFTVLLIPAFVAISLLVVRIAATDSTRYLFLVWNLLLGFIPLLILVLLRIYLKTKLWRSVGGLLLTFAFVAFLPNSFYIMTDYTHLRGASEVNVNYDILMINAFVFAGLLWGYCATLEFHKELRKRLPEIQALIIMGAIFLASSFAIYLGRFVRWNSWDILVQPAAIIFDVIEQLINPNMHSNAYLYTSAFFIVLFSLHYTLWRLLRKR